MKIVRAIEIDDAALLSSNAGETAAPYNAGTTYAANALVRSDADHRIYRSVASGNVGHALSDISWWTDIAPANVWAMFDLVNGTATTGASGLDITVRPAGRLDTIALLNIVAAEVHVTITDAVDGVVFDQVYSMVDNNNVVDAWTYQFEPILMATELTIEDLIPYNAPTIRIQASSAGGIASIGTFIAGLSRELGSTAWGVSLGITDSSRKEKDEYGIWRFAERSYSRNGEFEIMLNAEEHDEAMRLLSVYRATPMLFLGSSEYLSMVIFGFYTDLSCKVDAASVSFLRLKVEDLAR